MYQRSLFIFRQDLRIQDNTALIQAIQHSNEVFPIFIHDLRAINDFGEDDPRFGFIRELLENIDIELQSQNGGLTVYSGNPETIIYGIILKHKIGAVYCNASYSPKGKERDIGIERVCRQAGIDFYVLQDFLLVEPHEVEQRKTFTSFSFLWKKFLLGHTDRIRVKKTHLSQVRWYMPHEHQDISEILRVPYHHTWTLNFGKARMRHDFSEYAELRNFPALDGSTRLSPYIRFGAFSVREVYAKVSDNPSLLSEIIWREFWYHIAYYFPFVYDLEFQQKRQSMSWRRDVDSDDFVRFEEGKTGYPLVDAAIKQLIQENWMHNRLRMVVASFLTKNMGFDWRIGEKWFKKYLIDYDETINIGNWQWSASVGADPRPLRIFNPLLQSERFDPEGRFIKKYLPELAEVIPSALHTLRLDDLYIEPIFDQKASAMRARDRYNGYNRGE